MPDKPEKSTATTPTLDADTTRAFQRLAQEAEALRPNEVIRWYGEPSLIADNVRRGRKAVLDQRKVLEKALPAADWQLVEDAAERAMAAVHAFALADRAVAVASRPFAEHRNAVSDHRTVLFAVAELLVSGGHVDRAEVDAIRAGTGLQDLAADVLALCKLAKRAGKAAPGLVDAKRLKLAADDAESFQARLRPAHRKGDSGKKGEAAAAAHLRDRYFTLVVHAHRECRRIGHWLWVDELDQHVPSLQARRIPG